MKTKLFLLFIITFFVTSVTFAATELDYMEHADDATAQAAYVTSDGEDLGQQNTTVNSNGAVGDAGNSEYRRSQGFQLSSSRVVSAVEVKQAGTVGSPTGNWTLRIETDSSGKPSGTLADANASIAVSPPGNGNSVKGTFATSFSLNGSTTYHLVVQCDDQSTDHRWTLSVDGSGNPYANGTMSYSTNSGSTWTIDGTSDLWFKVYYINLQSYSESSIKQQGTYSLKALAELTVSLNETLTRTVAPTVDLTDLNTIKLDIRASRTGSNVKIGIHDSGGTTTEHTANIASADSYQTETWDIGGVSNANKDAIDSIIITVTNADADNTVYVDNMYGTLIEGA